jgi:hypothetical protein
VRRVLHRVPEVRGWGSATAGLDATGVASDVITSAVQQAATEQALVLELARPQGRLGLSGADGVAVRRSWATATTGTEGSVAECCTEETPEG